LTTYYLLLTSYIPVSLARPTQFAWNASRRSFLQSTSMGLGWLALQACHASKTRGDEHGNARLRRIDPLNPFEARESDFTPRAKSVIFLFMVGGPSQIDTFDFKPALLRLDGKPVPDSIRKAVEASRHANVFHGCKPELMASPYRFSQYGQSRTWVSSLFPHVAEHVDELAFIYSMQADSNNHAPASYQLHTGDVRGGKASLGSWITFGLGTENTDLPGYVVLFDAGPLGGAANYSNGFLPPAFQPTRLRDRGLPVLDLLPPEAFSVGQRQTIDLMQKLNTMHRDNHPGFSELDARIASYELAYRMQSAAIEVGGFEDEPKHIHEIYGLNDQEKRTQNFGRKCLLSRRLVERGVRFVQLYDMPDKDGWDAHEKLTNNHDPRAKWTDLPVAWLLTDLKQRGLLDSTLVIWASEFGRTPMMQGTQGRQHNAAGFTIWMTGGGIRPGARIGSTDEIGLMATERPVQFRDLHATILTALGLRFENLSFEVSGRAERLTGVAGSAKPMLDLLT
ncbi:MAG: DUF1501 domain-containing protein, partial [Pirellula sp.]